MTRRLRRRRRLMMLAASALVAAALLVPTRAFAAWSSQDSDSDAEPHELYAC